MLLQNVYSIFSATCKIAKYIGVCNEFKNIKVVLPVKRKCFRFTTPNYCSTL